MHSYSSHLPFISVLLRSDILTRFGNFFFVFSLRDSPDSEDTTSTISTPWHSDKCVANEEAF